MLSRPLTYFETHINYQKQPNFSCVYSGNDLPKIKADAINLGKYKLIRSHWIALCVNGNIVTWFNSFGGEHIPKEIENLTYKYHSKYQLMQCVDTFVLDLLILC